MNPIVYIRREVFGCETQTAFAAVLGTSQVNISRWEKNGRIPGHKQSLIRNAAVSMERPWDDRWFFSAPTEGLSA